MPIIIDICYNPTPSVLEHPLSVGISLRVPSAGPVTIRIRLDESLPYFFISGGRQEKELCFTRTFGSSGDHTTRFTLTLMSPVKPLSAPSIIVIAAGIDGSSMPSTMVLDTIESNDPL